MNLLGQCRVRIKQHGKDYLCINKETQTEPPRKKNPKIDLTCKRFMKDERMPLGV
jgi:hypothetical protein